MQKQIFGMSSIPWVRVQRRSPSLHEVVTCFLPLPAPWPGRSQSSKPGSVGFSPPSRAALPWQQPRAILRAAKFTEEHSETASSELGVYFQAALLQQGQAEGQSSGYSSFLVCELGYGSQNRREQTASGRKLL